MIVTPDYPALIRAINFNPGEDTPRLALADYIDEHAESDADRGRAEFIRVQIELHNAGIKRIADATPDELARVQELSRREQNLRQRFVGLWFTNGVHAWVRGFPVVACSFNWLVYHVGRNWLIRHESLLMASQWLRQAACGFHFVDRRPSPNNDDEFWYDMNNLNDKGLGDDPDDYRHWVPGPVYAYLEGGKRIGYSYHLPRGAAGSALDAALTKFFVTEAYRT